MAESRQRSRLPVKLIIVALLLMGLYSLAGFLMLPWWLTRAIPDQLEQHMGWQAEVGDIRSNPFALSLEAFDLAAQDSNNEKVVGFDRLYINVSFFELVRGVGGFQAIELEEPFIRLDLLEDFSVNFVRDFQAASSASPGDAGNAPKPEEDKAPPSLYFERIALNGGELLFRDFTQQEVAEFRIMPLDLTLSDLATWQRDDRSSDYHLQAAMGEQTLEWQGNLSVTPLYSNGSLSISGIDHETLGHFLAPYLPYDLRGGAVSLSSDYELQAGDTLYLVTRNGQLTVQELALSPYRQGAQPGLTATRIGVDDIGFDLYAGEATVGQISLEQPALSLVRNKSGSIDWIAALAEFSELGGGSAPESQQPSAPENSQPFRWSLQGIEISQGRVRWQDQQPESPAELLVEPLSLSVGSLDSGLEDPVRYKLKAGLASGGELSVNGQVTPQPFTLEAAIAGTDIVLSAFEPYLQESANLAIAGGTLGLDGNLDLDGQQEPLTGTFSGTAGVSGLDLKLPGSAEKLLSWQTLRLAPIEYNVHPARLEIGTVTLAQPAFNLVRDTNNLHNVEQISRVSEGASAEVPPQQEAESGPGFIFRIGQLMIEEAAVDYTDRTLDPAFTTSLNHLNGSVTGLSNVPPQQGKVSLTGRVGDSATIDFDGTLGALGTDEASSLKLMMKELSLPALSPYLGQYLGYSIDSGKLEMDLDYEIAGSQISASNRVVMDRLGLGRAVASEQAINAPVKLGLALLRDSNGVIEVNLPISGDMSSPDFSVGQVVMRAFVNLLAKAATSPFSMLGSIAELAGLSGEELGQVAFEPGSTRLAPGEAEKLTALGKALLDRPNLLLNVRGGVSPAADGLVLLREELAASQSEELTEETWNEAREAYLAGERSLAPEALTNLANARGAALMTVLRDTHGVPASQLFMLEPARDAQVTEGNRVIVGFTLDAR